MINYDPIDGRWYTDTRPELRTYRDLDAKGPVSLVNDHTTIYQDTWGWNVVPAQRWKDRLHGRLLAGLPVGYSQARPIDAVEYLESNPQDAA